MEKKKWFYGALVCIAISILSMFSSVISYTTKTGLTHRYSILDLLEGDRFADQVLWEYTGPVLWDIDAETVTPLAVLAVAAILCAVIGLITLRAQRPNRWQFVLTIAGLIGTAVPSFLVILAVILSNRYFRGSISCGIAPIITPISMAVCIAVVVRRRNRVQELLQKEMEEKGLIWKAGDL